ncbi:MAG: Histidinol-phosphatase [Firmicutes bacterium ADurb.Bin373]|nr:histidinol-phosphatase HisJ family protein [Bacillota bacterium]OQA08809.1 MAG: Histidinol-phosphatase [Firmicutes bacterium ADurb.Bin373]
MLPVDNHLHTRLCGHASGEIYEYLDAAARRGIREVGFCDHLPLYFLPPEKTIPGYAMSESDLPGYVSMVKSRARQAPVRVKLGIEADFVPGHEDHLANILASYRFDFVTGSVHFIDGWGFDNPAELAEYARRDIDAVYRRYFALLQQAALTGLFDIMAHPDLVKKFNLRPTRDPRPLYEETARVFKSAGVCVEVNTAGLRYPVKEIYPGPELLEIFFKYGLPVTLGSDAHLPEDVGAGLPAAVELIKNTGYREVATFSGRQIKFVKI